MPAILALLGIAFSVAALACTIWLAVIAFRVQWWWGLLVLFGCGIGTIVFAVMHWDQAKKPFLLGLVAGVLGAACQLGAAAMGAGAAGGAGGGGGMAGLEAPARAIVLNRA